MMLVFLLLSLELHISPNPIEGKVGEKIPFTVRVLDKEGKILERDLSFSVVPGSLGRVQGNFFIANKEGKGVLRCRSTKNGKHLTGFAYIKISSRESAKIVPPIAILKKGEQIKFTIDGGTAKEWKCIPAGVGNIRNGIFTAENSGRGRVIALLTNGEIKTAFVRVSGVISDIQITPRFKRIKVGETVRFETKGNERVTWKVEGENTGEINSNGVFKAKTPGKAVIIAEKNGNQGRAIVVVSGEVGLRIIPESVTIKTGERVHFKVNAEGFGNVNIPVSWKVIPERCGQIRQDGTFIAGEIPMKGRVIAILPQRFGKGVVSANVYITSEVIKPLEIIPPFKQFTPDDIDKEFRFSIIGAQKIDLQWRVIPEVLGSINNNGVFVPKRLGAGVVMAEPRAAINIKPARAFVIIGADRYMTADTASLDAQSQVPGFIDFAFPSQQMIEGFRTPLTLHKEPDNYIVIWKIIPPDAGRIILNREFQANKLPEGIDQRNVKVFAILSRGREIVAWTSMNITVIKAK
jgi:plastocyanin